VARLLAVLPLDCVFYIYPESRGCGKWGVCRRHGVPGGPDYCAVAPICFAATLRFCHQI